METLATYRLRLWRHLVKVPCPPRFWHNIRSRKRELQTAFTYVAFIMVMVPLFLGLNELYLVAIAVPFLIVGGLLIRNDGNS